MGKSLRARLKELFCCFHDDFSNSDSAPPNNRQASLQKEEISAKDENPWKINQVDVVKKTTIKKIEVQMSDPTSEKCKAKNSEINSLTNLTEKRTNLKEVELEIEKTIKAEKLNDRVTDTRKEIKCLNTSIGRKVDTGYLINSLLENLIHNAPEDRLADKQPKFPAFKQTVTTHQGKLHDRSIVNTWSRHMSDMGQKMYFTNVNMNKINIPCMNTEIRRGIVEDGEAKKVDLIKNKRSGLKDDSDKKHVSSTDLILDTRNEAVRPKAAGRERTKHCFTNSGVYKKL